MRPRCKGDFLTFFRGRAQDELPYLSQRELLGA